MKRYIKCSLTHLQRPTSSASGHIDCRIFSRAFFSSSVHQYVSTPTLQWPQNRHGCSNNVLQTHKVGVKWSQATSGYLTWQLIHPIPGVRGRQTDREGERDRDPQNDGGDRLLANVYLLQARPGTEGLIEDKEVRKSQ